VYGRASFGSENDNGLDRHDLEPRAASLGLGGYGEIWDLKDLPFEAASTVILPNMFEEDFRAVRQVYGVQWDK
jgi:hypothetical protein